MKIGCVPYGHAKPFTRAWAGQEPIWAHPKELAKRLWSGEVDLALVPVWEVLQRPGTRAVDRVAIGSRGAVRSVGVFHDRPLGECRSIQLSPHSATSVQLWRLVAQQQKLRLEEEETGDARLLIGDEALQEWSRRRGKGMLDLGQAWADWTGKPFVFAVWALSPTARIDPGELERFREACQQGIDRRAELAQSAEEREYLTRCIRYQLGREEKDGLEEFAVRAGLRGVAIPWV